MGTDQNFFDFGEKAALDLVNFQGVPRHVGDPDFLIGLGGVQVFQRFADEGRGGFTVEAAF
jgi:hypothetical protein